MFKVKSQNLIGKMIVFINQEVNGVFPIYVQDKNDNQLIL